MTAAMAEPSADNLVWLDLEMSGLDPQQCVILEIATIVTDADLRVIAEGPVLAIHQPESVLEAMDDWNREHHAASGLSARVRTSTHSVADAEAATLAFVQRLVDEAHVTLLEVAQTAVHELGALRGSARGTARAAATGQPEDRAALDSQA